MKIIIMERSIDYLSIEAPDLMLEVQSDSTLNKVELKELESGQKYLVWNKDLSNG